VQTLPHRSRPRKPLDLADFHFTADIALAQSMNIWQFSQVFTKDMT
jgi:hypothetical protein